MTVTGERRCWNEKLQVIKNDYRRVSPGSWFGPRFSTTPLLIAYRLNCMIPAFSVETKSCTTQQELSQSGVSAPTCETFEIAVSSYTYPSHTHAHTHNNTTTFTQRGLRRRRVLIRLHPKLPPTGPEGDMNLKRQCSANMKLLLRRAAGTPVKTCFPETCQEGGSAYVS